MDQKTSKTIGIDDPLREGTPSRAALDLMTYLPPEACSLAAVAARTGLGLADLEREFGTFDDLVVHAIGQWRAERLQRMLTLTQDRPAVELVRVLVEDYVARPATARLLIRLYEISAIPTHPLAQQLRGGRGGLLRLVEDVLRADAARGDERIDIDPAQAAIQLVAVYEGLQMRSLREPAPAIMAAFDWMVAAARRTWLGGRPARSRR